MHSAAQVCTFDPHAHKKSLVKYIIGAVMPRRLLPPPTLNMLEVYIYPQYQIVTRKNTRSDLIDYYNKRQSALIDDLKK